MIYFWLENYIQNVRKNLVFDIENLVLQWVCWLCLWKKLYLYQCVSKPSKMGRLTPWLEVHRVTAKSILVAAEPSTPSSSTWRTTMLYLTIKICHLDVPIAEKSALPAKASFIPNDDCKLLTKLFLWFHLGNAQKQSVVEVLIVEVNYLQKMVEQSGVSWSNSKQCRISKWMSAMIIHPWQKRCKMVPS